MHSTWLPAVGLLSGLAASLPNDLAHQNEITRIQRRAAPANQPHGYAPQYSACPSDSPSIRPASELSPEESSWLPVRRNATVQPMRELLSRVNISGFDAGSYIDQHSSNATNLPNIGIAISGGGYRAMLNGAGVISAFDNRTVNSTSTGNQLGGLLQAATYLSGLSGGGWLVGSLYSNNFTSVQSILSQPDSDTNDLWQIENTIFEGPESNKSSLTKEIDYWSTLVGQVDDKSDQGFNISITDYWGRALSFQLINATDGGPDYTFSSIATQDWFTSGTAPLPILLSDGRAPNTEIVSSNSTIYEFNPWELGSWDPTTYAFAPLKYVGTNFSAGTVTNSSGCVTGFDSASFVMGTSSSLFNAALTTLSSSNASGIIVDAIQGVLKAWDGTGTDIASWPNPFYRYNNVTDPSASSVQLTLTDGGEDGQNVPLTPLIQPDRHVDVIFAVDTSADTTNSTPSAGSQANWPQGVSLVDTYERSLSAIGNGTVFPPVPDINTFVNLGFTYSPVFFGCNASNLTGPAPIVIYLPNAPYVYDSNTSTYDLDYNDTQRNQMINNGYDLATQGNGSVNSDWGTCVGCAILSRSFDRTNTTVPAACTQCFTKYCWNGTLDSSTPAPYNPPLKLSQDATSPTASGASSQTSSGPGSASSSAKSGAERWSLPAGLAAGCISMALYWSVA